MTNFGHLFSKILPYICGENLNHEKIPVRLSLCRCTHRYMCAWVSTGTTSKFSLLVLAWPCWMLTQSSPAASFPSLINSYDSGAVISGCGIFVLLAFVVSNTNASARMLCLWISNEIAGARKWECHCSKCSLAFA